MLMRWGIRIAAALIGFGALLGVGWALHKYGMTDPKRERFKEGTAASAAIRTELGRDCNLTVEPYDATEEQVVVTVNFVDEPADPAARRELVRSANIIVRRHVHHVHDLNVTFGGEREVIPSWDGGVAVPGAPEPIGVKAPSPQPTAAAVVDAGTPAKATVPKTKTGTVTLVTFPEADVFNGAQKLGRTPLFNAELPVGTHLLTLVGADGARHRLSMPVKIGKNKPLKMNLADLPVR